MSTGPTITSCPSCGYSPHSKPLVVPAHTPRFEQLLQSNECPTQDEEQKLRSFLTQGESELQKLEFRIEKVRTLLKTMESSMEEIKVSVAKHKLILNPVRRLPTDIMREIFLLGAGLQIDAENHFNSTSHSLDLTSPPWVYGRVCRLWTEVSIHTPLLWTRIKLVTNKIISKRIFYASYTLRDRAVFYQEQTYTTPAGPRTPFALFLLSTYLARSASLPLTVYLEISQQEFWSSASDAAWTFFTLLLSHSHRWAALFLAESHGNLPRALSKDSLPLLKHLQTQEPLRVHGAVWGIWTIDIVAPELKSWSTVGERRTLSAQTKPSAKLFSQITTYSLSQVSITEIREILGQLPLLTKLSVRDLPNEVVTPSPEPLLLTTLTELFLGPPSGSGTDSPEVLSAFIDSISCPELKSLTVTTPHLLHEPIQRLELRSAFRLERLNISAQSGIFVVKDSGALKELVVRDIGEMGDYVPFVSIQDVLSHLMVKNDSDSESDIAIVDLNSGGSEPTPVGNSPSHAPSNTESPRPKPKLPFPNLSHLELRFSSSPTVEDYDPMKELFLCITSRHGALEPGQNSSFSPHQVFMEIPGNQARKMLTHPCLNELRSLGLKVEVVGL